MRSFFGPVLVAALAAVSSVQAAPYPFNAPQHDVTSLHIRSSNISAELGPLLSNGSSIFTQDDPRFANATDRYQAYKPPQFSVVVEPATEKDIATIVKYANSRNIPFLPVNRAHATTTTLSKLTNGIEIRMNTLNQLVPNEDRTTALMGAGVYGDQVLQTLWDIGYVTTTGSCGCVGMLGPALGGGLGRYEGFYGLIADNIVSYNVVLADGSAITVSEDSHSDLYWGIRGAGHNFGIVTSFNIKIYKKTVESWYYATYIYTQDKLEDLTEVVNKMMNNGSQPKELMNYGVYTMVPQVDSKDPALIWTIYYVGTAEEAATYLSPFLELGPVSVSNDSIPYPEIPDATGTGSNTPLCDHGLNQISHPIGLLTYNVTANRQIYSHLQDLLAADPAFNLSAIILEGYSVKGVQAVEPDSTAYPHRDDNILIAVAASYAPNPALDEQAISWSREGREILHAGDVPGRKKTAYVNYAYGEEPIEEIYGYEPWRLERLTALKKKYDGQNRFGFYNPIPI